jgi:fatty-acyl-CoA synthase
MCSIVKTDSKFSYCHSTSNQNFKKCTIRDLLFEVSDKFPNNVAYIFKSNKLRLTVKEIKDKSFLLAHSLLRLGLKKSDRAVVLVPNTPEFIIIHYAAALIGLVTIPISPVSSLVDIEYVIKKMKPTLIFIENSIDYHNINKNILPEIYELNKVNFKSSNFSGLKYVIAVNDVNFEDKSKAIGCWSYDELNQSLNEKEYDLPHVESEDDYTIWLTVGF